MKKRLYGKVEKNLTDDFASWIVLEEDPDETGGVFLYGYESLNDPCDFDEWYDNIRIAMDAALKRWVICGGKWEENPSSKEVRLG